MDKEGLKHILAVTSSVSTILQFLAGTLVCQKIVKKKSTGDTSGLPFVCGFLSTTLWLRYGFLIQEPSLILVNTVGATLHFAYVVTFYMYSIKKSIIVKQFFICKVLLSVMIAYSMYESERSTAIKCIGVLCCIMTIIFFAAPLASLMHVVNVKSAESLPFPVIFMSFIVTMQWFVYGFLLSDTFIQVPNFLGCILSGFQLSLFCVYPKKAHVEYSPIHNF